MWINKAKTSSPFLGLDSKDNFISKIGSVASAYAKFNPGTKVQIWYDSALLTSANDTIAASLATFDPDIQDQIVFRDVRELAILKDLAAKKIEIFALTSKAFWVRTDLLRAMVIDAEITNYPNKKCIYSDLDVIPMARKQLLDQRTLNRLKTWGFVLDSNGSTGFLENSFMIFDGQDTITRDLHRKIIIDKIVKDISEGYGTYDNMVFDNYKILLDKVMALHHLQLLKNNSPAKSVARPRSQQGYSKARGVLPTSEFLLPPTL